MNTIFYTPTNIIQRPIPDSVESISDSVEWVINNNSINENSKAYTSKPLYTISGLWMEKFLSKTNQLWCTNLNIPLDTRPIAGIEFLLDIDRKSRIEDLTIQLTLNDELIGDNFADPVYPVQANMYTGDNNLVAPIVEDYNIYGGPDNLWGANGLTNADVSNSSFGIVIGFVSNKVYPHRDIPVINRVGIGITYG
jgi:hypothetical protein